MTFEQKVFTRFDLPTGRDVDSFTYRVIYLWNDSRIDEYLTDDKDELIRMIHDAKWQQYTVKIEFGTKDGG